MKKIYDFTYGVTEASVSFIVDTDIFKPESAKILLDFFSWDYDEDADPIDELMKKWALQAIEIATAENYNEYGVKSWFEESEGFMKIDGSMGIELRHVEQYEFSESSLFCEIKPCE